MLAILSETAATLSLRASVDDPRWFAVVALGYVIAFAALGLALRVGMPIGAAYGIWGASGVALTALLGTVLFGEHLGLLALIGIALIMLGVVLVETGGAPHEPGAAADAGPTTSHKGRA